MAGDDDRTRGEPREIATAAGEAVVSRLSANRRTVLSLLGAGVAGAAVSNPGTVAGLLQGMPGLDDGEKRPAELVPPKRMDVRAVQAGAWSDAATWDERVPTEGDWVQIPTDVSVTLDGETARLKALRVDGTLSVDPRTDTHLVADTVVTTHGSRLAIGTDAAPVAADATARLTFADFGPIDTAWDPERVSRGLIAMGDLSIRGAETTTWTALDAAPTAGDRTLTLPEAPTDWSPGDELVVPGLSPLSNQDERVTVAAVDGATVRLTTPLEYDHVPPKASFDAYVLSLSRNVRLASETTDVPRRGHVMVHGTESDIRYAAFEGLGRTDKSYPFTDGLHGTPPTDVEPNPKARYALHYHKTGIDEPPHVVEGAVVDGSPGWGVVNHHSHAVVRDSITHEVFGAGFVAEAGNERGAFERNFALRSEGSGERMKSREFEADGDPGHVDDFGHGGHGFWLQGSQVELRDNVAAGHRHHGFAFWNRSLVDRPLKEGESIGDRADNVENFPTAFVDGMAPLLDSDEVVDGMAPASHLPLRAFEDNTAFASGGGLALTRHQFRWTHERFAEYGTVDGFTAYEIGPVEGRNGRLLGPEWDDDRGGNQGILFRYARNVRVRDAHLVGRGPGSGINRNEPYTRKVLVEDSIIEGWEVGVRASEDLMVLRGNTFDNQIDVNVEKERLPELLTEGNRFRRKRTANVRFENVEADHVDLDELFWPDWDDGIVIEGRPAYFGQQGPERVPIPNSKRLKKHADPGGDDWKEAARRLGTDPTALVGKTNAELMEAFGVAAYGGPFPEQAERTHTVTGGRTAAAPTGRPQSVWLDAAAGALGDIFRTGTDPSAGNERFIVARGAQSRDDPPTESGVATYTVDLAAGAYALYGRVWAMDGNSFWLRVDGGEWLEWDGLRSYRGWEWHTVERAADDEHRPRRFDLSAGEHTLEVGYRENRVRLDTLLLEADGTTPIGRGLAPGDES